MKKFKLWSVPPLRYEPKLRKAVKAQSEAITSLTRLCHEQNRLLVALSQAVNSEAHVTRTPVTPIFGVAEMHTLVTIECDNVEGFPDLVYNMTRDGMLVEFEDF